MNFGYPWWMTYGHLVLAAPAVLAAVWLIRKRRAKVVAGLLVLLAVWSTAAFFVTKFGFRLDAPVKPPAASFLASGSGKVLDMGCGSGRASIGLLLSKPRATVVGLDNWSAGYIKGNGPDLIMANARAVGVHERLTVESADMRALPFSESSFDAVISAYAVDHLDGPGIGRALEEAKRVLRPGGELLLLNMSNDAWTKFAYTPLLGLHSSRASHGSGAGPAHAAMSPEIRWQALLEHAGFEVVEIGHRPGTLYLLARKPGLRTAS
jgi:SAM-dependent methyltransferase